MLFRPKRSMKRLYEESEIQQQRSSQPVADSQDDAELERQPFGSRTQSDQPAQGISHEVLSPTASSTVLCTCNRASTVQKPQRGCYVGMLCRKGY